MKKSFNASWLSCIKARLTDKSWVSKNFDFVEISDKDNRRKASVLISLCNRHQIASVLYTVRSQNVGTHKGHVSFPGGHIMEEIGESAVEAATRECYEEIGDSVGPIEILGQLPEILAITGTVVTPVIGFIQNDCGDLSHLRPDAHEVEKVFTRSIEELPEMKSYETFNRLGKETRMPVFTRDGDGDERIWGLTAYITEKALGSINHTKSD